MGKIIAIRRNVKRKLIFFELFGDGDEMKQKYKKSKSQTM